MIGHPGSYSYSRAIAKIVKQKYSGNNQCHAIVIPHPYQALLNIDCRIGFDASTTLNNCDFNKNIIAGIKSYLHFKRSIRGIIFSPGDVMFGYQTMEFPLQLLMKLARKAGVKVVLIDRPSVGVVGKIGIRHTLLNFFYSLVTGVPLMRTLLTSDGKFLSRSRIFEASDLNVILGEDRINPNNPRSINLPDPTVLLRSDQKLNENDNESVLLLTDATLDLAYPEINFDIMNAKLNEFIGQLKKFYSGKTILFKPHPLDNNASPRGLDLGGIEKVPPCLADEYFLENFGRIIAVYTVCSTAIKSSCLMGLPSYAIYPAVIEDKTVVSNIDSIFVDYSSSPCYRVVFDHSEIGDIDGEKRYVNLHQTYLCWMDFLRNVVFSEK